MDADSSSIGSDHVTHSRGRSVASRNSERAEIQSLDTRSTHGITFNVPDDDNNDNEREVEEDPGLISYDSSEDLDV